MVLVFVHLELKAHTILMLGTYSNAIESSVPRALKEGLRGSHTAVYSYSTDTDRGVQYLRRKKCNLSLHSQFSYIIILILNERIGLNSLQSKDNNRFATVAIEQKPSAIIHKQFSWEQHKMRPSGIPSSNLKTI